MLDELVACPKQIIQPPKKAMTTVNGSQRNGMRVVCAKGRQFSVFMRISEEFNENFSIGLQYEPPDDSPVILLRCNGPHGEVVQSLTDQLPEHYDTHIHRATEENIREGRRPESGAVATRDYATYAEALKVFLGLANIEWTREHFPELSNQKTLFE